MWAAERTVDDETCVYLASVASSNGDIGVSSACQREPFAEPLSVRTDQVVVVGNITDPKAVFAIAEDPLQWQEIRGQLAAFVVRGMTSLSICSARRDIEP